MQMPNAGQPALKEDLDEIQDELEKCLGREQSAYTWGLENIADDQNSFDDQMNILDKQIRKYTFNNNVPDYKTDARPAGKHPLPYLGSLNQSNQPQPNRKAFGFKPMSGGPVFGKSPRLNNFALSDDEIATLEQHFINFVNREAFGAPLL